MGYYYCTDFYYDLFFFCHIKIPNRKKKDTYHQDYALSGEGCLILNYHRVRSSNSLVKSLNKWTIRYSSDSELTMYSIYETEFKEQIMYLINEGFSFITPDELKHFLDYKETLPKKCALITFDDADISVYRNAYPFLVEKEIPFTLFIITGEVGNPNFHGLELASWKQIKEMLRSGLVTIGTHTHRMHHLDKSNNPPFLNENKIADFINDTQLTIETVEEKLGFTPIFYAYPYGFGMPQTDNILLEAGYEMIFTLRPGIVKQGDPAFFLKRVLITRDTWPKVKDWVRESRGRFEATEKGRFHLLQ